MPGEISFPRHGEGDPAGESLERRRQHWEALGRAIDHAQYLQMETKRLPPRIGHIIELLSLAQQSLLDAERQALQPREKWDTDGHAAVRAFENLKKQALHQLEAAVRELNPQTGNVVDVSAERD